MERLSDFVVLVLLFTMAVATAISIVTSYYLYRWRRIVAFDGKLITVPEELISTLTILGKGLKAVQRAVGAVGSDQKRQENNILLEVGNTNKAIKQVLESAVSLQGALDQRDAEIERLKQGYDAELIRRFVARFIRVKIALSDAQATGATGANTLHDIHRLLDDALDECGVEEFRPQISDDFRTAAGVGDNPRIVQTEDVSQNFRIADILEPGYRFRTGPNRDVILPAKVSIYVTR